MLSDAGSLCLVKSLLYLHSLLARQTDLHLHGAWACLYDTACCFKGRSSNLCRAVGLPYSAARGIIDALNCDQTRAG
ncbi:hypothetical protein V8C37DRAFT_379627 [Trichoderma ceciliae]